MIGSIAFEFQQSPVLLSMIEKYKFPIEENQIIV